MADFMAETRTASPGSKPVGDPTSVVLTHHRTRAVEIRVDRLTGGHLLHLAVAGCVFNTVHTIAADRHIAIDDCRVSVDGGFNDTAPRSAGITYEIEITGAAPAEELTAIARDADTTATIPNLLREATEVRLSNVIAHQLQNGTEGR